MDLRTRRHSGFTLTEVMVALGIMLILMLAVNAIFSRTADTISAGQALSTALRDMRAVQTVIKRDLDGAVMADGPFFLIRSNVQAAFHSQKDRLVDADYAATGTAADLAAILSADPTGSGTEVDQPLTGYGIRAFRQDTLAFFSRGRFGRQTGNDGLLSVPMTSSEAFVWYGHLLLPDRSAAPAFLAPGVWDGGNWRTVNTNPDNFYASQWICGRMAILLRQPQFRDPADGTGLATDRVIYCDPPFPTDPLDPRWASHFRQAYLGTLTADSPATQNGTSLLPWRIQQSRFDLAGTTISDYRTAVAAFGSTWPDYFRYRFCADPSPLSPIDSRKAAQTAPIFLPRCSQFAVEYAGDFTTQDGAGRLLPAVGGRPDGTIDFIIDPVTNSRQTRWYGMPRDVGGTGRIQGISAAGRYGNDLLNVVPLRDVLQSQGLPPATFERVVPDQKANYALPPGGNGLQFGQPYECAWGPDTADTPMPMMLRILIKSESPQDRADLPWQEMVFTLP